MATNTRYETLNHYTFDLRKGLSDAAKVGLNQLEDLIGDIGYGWLDGHMEEIMSRNTRAPIMDLMKTPSRTQTVKKTRAATTAMKEKGEKIRALNLQVGSPMSKGSTPSRAPLSPLQPRSVNAAQMLSPSPMKANPAKMLSPIRGSPLRSSTPSKQRTTKSKGLQVQNENATVGSSAPSPARGLLSPRVPPKSPARAISAAALAKRPASPKTIVNAASPVPPSPTPTVPTPSAVDTLEGSYPGEPSQLKLSRSQPDDTARHIHFTSSSPSAPTTSRGYDIDPSSGKPHAHAGTAHAEAEVPSGFDTLAKPAIARLAASDSPSLPLDDGPVVATVPVTAAPMRQVRSSWLSKALGNGAMPIGAGDASDSRKSYAASAHRTEPIDFSSLRKSLAPVGTLAPAAGIATSIAPRSTTVTGTKRPSDGAVEDDKRPEKIFKVDNASHTMFAAHAIQASARTSDGPKVAQGSIVAASIFGPKTPAISKASVPSSDSAKTAVNAPSEVAPSAPTLEQARADRHRSDIHKVTRALDELRERTAAKEAHKQRATLHASSGPRPTTSGGDRQSTVGTAANGGFFRGLGSLGVGLGRSLGLGGSAKNAEEEAARLQAELEEERRAEEEARRELDKLMGEIQDEEATKREEGGGDKEPTERDTQGDAEVREEDGEADALDVELEAKMADEEEPKAVISMARVEVLSPKSPVRQTGPVTRMRSPPPAPAQTIAQVSLPSGTTAGSTPVKALRDVFESTTPAMSPPRRIFNVPQAKTTSPRPENESSASASAARVKSPLAEPIAVQTSAKANARPVTDDDEAEADELEEEVDLPELPEPVEADDERTDSERGDDDDEEDVKDMPAKKMFKPSAGSVKPKGMSASSSLASISSLAQSTSSNTGMFGQASTMGGKTLGFKPVTGQVKSLQMANAAAKKATDEQEANAFDKRAGLKAEVEQRKAEAARRKQEEDRVKAEEDKKARAAELEEKRRIRMEQDKKRKEREERLALAAREKAAKEEAEKAAMRAKAEEETKKRKLAQSAMLNKSTQQPPAKKATVPATGLGTKGKEPLRTIRPVVPASASGMAGPPKPGPGPMSFRTASMAAAGSSSATGMSMSTMALVQPKPAIGPPSRPSTQLLFQQGGYMQHQQQQQQQQQFQQQPKPAVILQQQRVHLQSHLDEKAAEIASEDIELPDIASEYSDSDDSDRSPDFKRPQWAESPELRNALIAQASRNPDELFGPIKPLNMEELFKTKTNKFRARSSSANWNGGDRLTKAEEVEYARRMGFKPIVRSGLGSGSGQ